VKRRWLKRLPGVSRATLNWEVLDRLLEEAEQFASERLGPDEETHEAGTVFVRAGRL